MAGGIGALVKDTNHFNAIVQDPVVQNVPSDMTGTASGKEPGHAAPNFGKIA